MRVEEIESLETFEVVIGMGRKTREGGRHQRVMRYHNSKTRRPSEAIPSCGGPEPRDGRRGTGSGKCGDVKKRKKNRSVIHVMWEARRLGRKKEINVDMKVLVQ